MSHKVHPKIYRVSKTEDWRSRWFATKNFSVLLEQDYKIREFLSEKLKDAAVKDIIIERIPGKLIITIETAKPAFIIGKGGKGLTELKTEIEKLLKLNLKKKKERDYDVEINVKEVKEFWKSAELVSQWIAKQIENRVPFKRVLKQAMAKICENKDVEGVKLMVSGRLDGVEIARTEWIAKGKLPRTTIKSDIDFARNTAFCRYGTVGIKVWIYKGERENV